MGLWDYMSAFGGPTLDYLAGKDTRIGNAEAQYPMQDRSAYDLPGYQQRNDQLGAYAQQYASDPFRAQQGALAQQLMAQAQGQNSFSRAQLGQDLGRLQAQQQSMAAGARPSQSAMAARLAMQNSGNLGANMAGQAQLAGIAERNAAAQALGGVLQGARGLDQSGYMGAQNLGLQNAVGQQAGTFQYGAEQSKRFEEAMKQPSQGEQHFGFLKSLGQGLGLSDIRAKKNIGPGGGMAAALANATAPSSWEYKEGAGPSGARVGPMAQQIEKVAPGAVKNTSKGKAITYGDLAPEMWAMAADANRRAQKAEAAASMLARRADAGPRDVSGIRGQLSQVAPGQLASLDASRRPVNVGGLGGALVGGGRGLPPGASIEGLTPGERERERQRLWSEYFPPNANPRDQEADSPQALEALRRDLWQRYLKRPQFDVSVGAPVIE